MYKNLGKNYWVPGTPILASRSATENKHCQLDFGEKHQWVEVKLILLLGEIAIYIYSQNQKSTDKELPGWWRRFYNNLPLYLSVA